MSRKKRKKSLVGWIHPSTMLEEFVKGLEVIHFPMPIWKKKRSKIYKKVRITIQEIDCGVKTENKL